MRTNEAKPDLKKAGFLLGTSLAALIALGVMLWPSGEPPKKVVATKSAATREKVGAPSMRAQVVTADEAVMPAVAGASTASVVTAPVVEVPPVTAPAEPVRYADAESAFLAKDWDRACALFAQFTEENPDHLWGHYLHGLSLRRAGRLDEAESAFVAALAIDPDHGKSLVNLGRVLLDAGRPADALVRVEKACELSPEDVDAQRVRGRALHSLDRRDEALAAYAAALAVDPDDAWSLNNTGLVLIEEERFADAREPLESACAADGGVAVFWNNLGVVLERTGEIAAARKAYAQAVALDPAHEKAAVSLARTEGIPGSGDAEPDPTLAIARPAPAGADGPDAENR